MLKKGLKKTLPRVIRGVWGKTIALGLLTVMTCNALPAAANNAQAQLQRFVAQVQQAHGTFVQTQISDTATSTTQSGDFAFVRPGKFRWEIRKPYAQLILSDGTHIWQYDPDLAQVTQRGAGTAMGASPAAILFGTAKLEDAFIVSPLPDADGLAWLRAQPRESDAGFVHVDIGLRNDQAVRLLLLDIFAQTTQIDLVYLQTQTPLTPETFTFQAPAGVDVVHMP